MEKNYLEQIYRRRFGSEIEFRKQMWGVLCRDFFQRYIPQDSVVLEVAVGYCEFINSIKAKRKIALDVNSDTKQYVAPGVELILTESINMAQVGDSSCDVVFVSNFFEHLTKDNIVKTIKEINRVLKSGGRLLILQPNIRFCYDNFWNFFDHITPLDDRSVCEVLECNGFQVKECRERFLPYTTKSNFPKFLFLLRLYLRLPLVQRILGKQSFIYSQKI